MAGSTWWLWTGNGFVLPQPHPVLPTGDDNPGWAKLGGKSARTKHIRSLTPRGFARAVYLANRDVVFSFWGSQVAETYGTIDANKQQRATQ